MIISTTKFTLKSWRLYPQFFVDTYRVTKQVRASGGIIHIQINPVSLRTITAWKTRSAMTDFRNSGAHLSAMKKSSSFGGISSVTWESETIPTWQEAIERLDAHEV